MFGHQDENAQNTQSQPWSQPAPVTVVSQPTANPAGSVQLPPTQPLLEPQATDGYTAAQPPIAPPPAVAPVTDAVGDNKLLDIKQQALQQLSPLVGQLDQLPEEKFRTTMMMIQASDNQDLISVAYEAANQITDEKAKAQALLDIVNEINYFTQH